MDPGLFRAKIKLRLLLAVYWIWILYFMLEICHILLSVFVVVILRVDTTEEWLPLFGSIKEAYEVRLLWTKFWHRLTITCCASSSRLVTRRFLGFNPSSFIEKCFIAFWTFFLPTIYHLIADWAAAEPCRPINNICCFLVNFLVAAVERFVASMWANATKAEKKGKPTYQKGKDLQDLFGSFHISSG